MAEPGKWDLTWAADGLIEMLGEQRSRGCAALDASAGCCGTQGLVGRPFLIFVQQVSSCCGRRHLCAQRKAQRRERLKVQGAPAFPGRKATRLLTACSPKHTEICKGLTSVGFLLEQRHSTGYTTGTQ